MTRSYNIILISIILIISCKPKKDVTQTNVENSVIEIIIDKTFVFEDNPEIKITQAVIKDSILSVTLNYTGCKLTDGFDLVFNGAYKKSLPLQVSLFLQKKETKNCETKFTKELKYNLSSLKRDNNNTIIINLKPHTNKLVYNY